MYYNYNQKLDMGFVCLHEDHCAMFEALDNGVIILHPVGGKDIVGIEISGISDWVNNPIRRKELASTIATLDGFTEKQQDDIFNYFVKSVLNLKKED